MLLSVDAASLLWREQNRHEPVCSPWPPTQRSALDCLLFTSRDVHIESTGNQSCVQKNPDLTEKLIILLLRERLYFSTG